MPNGRRPNEDDIPISLEALETIDNLASDISSEILAEATVLARSRGANVINVNDVSRAWSKIKARNGSNSQG